MFKIQFILLILLLVCQSSNCIRLIKSLNNLVGSSLMGTNLTSINLTSFTSITSISSQTVDALTNDTFLIDLEPSNVQSTKSKFYTIKTNGTNGLSIKYKRNNTLRSTDLDQLNPNELNHFESFGCDLCTNSSDQNCSENRTCSFYFKCSNSSNHLNSSNHDLIDRNNSKIFLLNTFFIEKKFYCDAICDCTFCEDEINCFLNKCDTSTEIMCQDKSSCIEPSKICDSIFDCKDHSDEIGCFDSRACSASGRFSCDNNLCIEKALVCDGLKDDCSDNADEQNCECNEKEFKCFNGQCINQNLRCNGVEFDCLDSSDEWNCVMIDERDIVLKISGLNHTVLCADSNFTIDDADEICKIVGKESAIEYSQIEIELENAQWVNKFSFWSNKEELSNLQNDLNKTNQLKTNLTNLNQSFICKDNLAQTVTCKKYNCSSIHRNATNNDRQIGTPNEIESMIRLQANHTDSNNNQTKLIDCFAQILSPMWLLSSFDCLSSLKVVKPDEIVLSLNRVHNLTNKVKRIILHPHSSIYRSMFIRNFDLGLIRLDKPIIFDEKEADAICLPNREVDIDITCFSTKFNDSESEMFLVVDRNKCNEFNHFNKTVLKDNLCTIQQKDHEDERQQTLFNIQNNNYLNMSNFFRTIRTVNVNQSSFPQGSPLICLNSDSKWFLAGFLNYFDDRNNLEHPTVFSNVHRMLNFITSVTGLSFN